MFFKLSGVAKVKLLVVPAKKLDLPDFLSKSTGRKQPVEDIPIFTCKYVGLWVCTPPFGHNKKYRPEIWYTYSVDHNSIFFCFFRNNDPEGR